MMIIIIVLGIAIPEVSYNSQYGIPEGIWYEVNILVDNPLEQIIVLGFKSVEDQSKDYSYHIEVKTIFG